MLTSLLCQEQGFWNVLYQRVHPTCVLSFLCLSSCSCLTGWLATNQPTASAVLDPPSLLSSL
jgi:hypothetical protein